MGFEGLGNLEELRLIFGGAVQHLDIEDFLHMNGDIREIEDTNDLHHAVQLFFDLLEGLVIAESTDGHTGDRWVLGGTHGEAVQVIGFSGEKAGDLREDAHLVFHIEGDPSFL